MTLGSFANGAGYVYVTAPDGVSIISNLENDPQIWQQVQKLANSSASLTDPTLESDSTYGYRFFGNTSGSQGNLTGSTEMTRFFVNRGAQTAAYKKAVTIATGVITLNRVSNNTLLYVSTEGGLADVLDTITMTGVVDNDTVTIVGANSGAGGIITVPTGTGNIFLSSSTSFVSGVRGISLVLRYFSAATAGWYEVSRNAIFPTVAQLRLSGIAEPVQGINTTAMGTSGTTTYVPGTDKGYQVITGSPVLVGAIVFATGGTPMDGDSFILDYRATPTIGGNTVTVFGITLTATQSVQKCIVRTTYNLTNTTWYSVLEVNGNAIDFATTTQLATKEDLLGNPGGDGYILSSLISGTRSWIPYPVGGSTYKFLTTSFSKTNATLASVTSLAQSVLANNTYSFEYILFISADVTGGSQYSIQGSGLTPTLIIYEVELISNAATGSYAIADSAGDLTTAVGQAGTTDGICKITGTISSSTTGTLILKFAQNAANVSSSILPGSRATLTQIG